MTLAEKRQQMVFAHAVKFNVTHDHHVVHIFFKNRAVDHFIQILAIASGQELPAAVDPLRGLDQTFPLRVFPDLLEERADFVLNIVHHTCSIA